MKMHITDLIETKARTEGTYAVAYAILQLAEHHGKLAVITDSIGGNIFTPTAGPGALEFIGMELAKIAQTLEDRGES